MELRNENNNSKEFSLTLLAQSQATEMNPVSITPQTRNSIPPPRIVGKCGLGVLTAFTINGRWS